MAQVFAGKRQRCIGILREVKNKWERRTPLIPADVSRLTKQGVRVLVQPSTMRIYKDVEFKAAGAELVEDISAANTIFGVKEFPLEQLIPEKSYMIFSHTIKAQPYNMPFLDACLDKRVRLFDYETIRSPPAQGGGRLVAFGKFAGFAGMIDCFRGLGERLLSLGYSSPFMGVSSSYMYPDLPAAKEAVIKAGEEIAKYGLPPQIAPLRFVFTGTGNVSQGARDIFELLPHKYVTPEELPHVPADPHIVYGCIVTAEHMVEPLEKGKPFDKKEYYESPQLYRPVFHEKIAPHMNVMVNCAYWDARFPRLITNEQMKELEHTYDSDPKARKFLALADITCDIQGSVEFLKRPCTIDNPFFMYNPLVDDIQSEIEGRGVLVLGIDNLPAEFPRDASGHFSKALEKFVLPLSESDPSKPFKDATSYLPPEIYNSCIAADGKLTPPFEYIQKLRAARSLTSTQTMVKDSSAADNKSLLKVDLMLEGHLFDTGFINQALDLFEKEGVDFELVQWVISPNRETRANNVSRAVIHVTFENEKKLQNLFQSIETLSARMPSAQAKLVKLTLDKKTQTYSAVVDPRNQTTITFPASAQAVAKKVNSTPSPSSGNSLGSEISRTKSAEPKLPKKKILVLGSGFVSGPLVEYLSRRPENRITVASAIEAESNRVIAPFAKLLDSHGAPRVNNVHLNVTDNAKLRSLIQNCDLVVSFLPAAFHPEVARVAIDLKKHMVTASYVSPQMKSLDESAKKAGVTLLNELGLDPGLDHLACAQIINEAHEKKQRVVSFQSLCGGLPAPEAANNPFAYKFSWSPLGMLLATQNNAVFRSNGRQVEIPSSNLLTSAQPLHLNSAFNLEYYANRDSLSYTGVYNIPQVESMFRGTIRYTGTSRLLHGYAKLGLLDRTPLKHVDSNLDWKTLLCRICGCEPSNLLTVIGAKLKSTGDFDDKLQLGRVIESMEWLGLFRENESVFRGQTQYDSHKTYSAVELLCAILQEKLAYAPGERDLVVMYHEFVLANANGEKTIKKSSLISYGGDDATRANDLLVNTPGGGGKKGYSAMSRTVGIPAAIGAQMILDGKLNTTGVIIPTQKQIYEPILHELKEKEGIEFVEEEKKLY